LSERTLDVGTQVLELGVVRFRPDTDHDVDRKMGWQKLQARQLAQSALELIAGDGRVSIPRHDQPHSHLRDHRMRERGSDDPDIEMSSSNALPLSRDALQLSTPRDPCMTRKAERRLGRSRLPRTCPGSGQ
jgi:hypothetical protein